jgi:hypothetical protein
MLESNTTLCNSVEANGNTMVWIKIQKPRRANNTSQMWIENFPAGI